LKISICESFLFRIGFFWVHQATKVGGVGIVPPGSAHNGVLITRSSP
jgi:hypothetical protein